MKTASPDLLTALVRNYGQLIRDVWITWLWWNDWESVELIKNDKAFRDFCQSFEVTFPEPCNVFTRKSDYSFFLRKE